MCVSVVSSAILFAVVRSGSGLRVADSEVSPQRQRATEGLSFPLAIERYNSSQLKPLCAICFHIHPSDAF